MRFEQLGFFTAMTARLLVLLKVSCMKHYEIASIVLGFRAFGDFLILVYILNSKVLCAYSHCTRCRICTCAASGQSSLLSLAEPLESVT